MASNHTPNYNLNQWERSDKVVMEDFNADNAAIDAALQAEADALTAAETAIHAALEKKADRTTVTALQTSLNSEISARKSAVETLTTGTQLQTILSHTQSASTTQIKLDLTSIRWTQWRRVYLFINAKGTGSSRAGFNDMVNLFDFSNNGDYLCLALMPLYASSLKVCGLLTGAYLQFVKSNRSYSELTNLEITCSSGTLAAGTTVILKGER